MTRPIQVGCIGAGGYASLLLQRFDRFIPRRRARVAAVRTSRPEAVARERHIVSQGTRLLRSVDELLAMKELDAVIVPTSIDTHLPYTRQALAAGKHVLCEKPVTAVIQDALAMIEARDRAGKVVAVGYQNAYSRSCRWAKRLVATGTIGAVRRAKVWATWPRPQSYYRRNTWAGKLKAEHGWVLDSPAGNALAHEINLLLWLTSPHPVDANRVVRVEAELYRANDIENYDTCGIRAETENGCQLLILFTHACAASNDPIVELEGETGVIRQFNRQRCQLLREGRVVEEVANRPDGPRAAMLKHWLDRIEGRCDRVACEIENALEVTRLVCGASAAAPVVDVGRRYVEVLRQEEDDPLQTIKGVESLFHHCYDAFVLPHETGLAGWTVPARGLDTSAFSHFEGPFGSLP